jgi:hypothetical protein
MDHKLLKENSILTIKNKDYSVLTMSIFTVDSDPDGSYIKMLLSDNHVLCIGSSEGDSWQFGKIIDAVPYDYPTPDVFEYDSKTYHKTSSAYQIVKQLVFGDSLLAEGEVKFIDYATDDESSLISVGVVVRTGERADVLLKNIDKSEVKLKEIK